MINPFTRGGHRAGLVNRLGCLHIRRNLADRHGDALRASLVGIPWEHEYELGLDERDHLGELAPRWVYPGPSKVQRMVLPYPLSRDAARYRNRLYSVRHLAERQAADKRAIGTVDQFLAHVRVEGG